MIKLPLAALTLMALTLSAHGDTPESLAGLQITGWEMIHGGAGQTEILGFHPSGRLTLEIAGNMIEGQWHLDEAGAALRGPAGDCRKLL